MAVDKLNSVPTAGEIPKKIDELVEKVNDTGVTTLPPIGTSDEGKVLIVGGGKASWQNVVNAIPYSETQNEAGGTTVTIGG